MMKGETIKSGETELTERENGEVAREKREMWRMVQELRQTEPSVGRKNIAMRPAESKVCDGKHLDGQRITVIDARDLGKTNFYLKLEEGLFANVLKEMQEKGQTASGAKVSKGRIRYESSARKRRLLRDKSKDCTLCDAFVFEREDEAGNKMRVFVANPWEKDGELVGNGVKEIRSAIGMVKMEVSREVNAGVAEDLLAQVMEEEFGVPDALDDVTAEDEADYKIVEYAKRMGKPIGELTAEEREQAVRLQRKEIFPGYLELVDEGRHREIEREFGRMYVVHTLHTGDTASVAGVLQGGLLDTASRFPRGDTNSGLSSEADMASGGADFVFMRVMAEDTLESMDPGTTVVFKPEILDWMPMWYWNDMFGSTDELDVPERMSTEQMFERIRQSGAHFPMHNEGMLPTGIGPQLVESILVDNEEKYREIVAGLKEKGIETFDGKPIEEVIKVQPRTRRRRGHAHKHHGGGHGAHEFQGSGWLPGDEFFSGMQGEETYGGSFNFDNDSIWEDDSLW